MMSPREAFIYERISHLIFNNRDFPKFVYIYLRGTKLQLIWCNLFIFYVPKKKQGRSLLKNYIKTCVIKMAIFLFGRKALFEDKGKKI